MKVTINGRVSNFPSYTEAVKTLSEMYGIPVGTWYTTNVTTWEGMNVRIGD